MIILHHQLYSLLVQWNYYREWVIMLCYITHGQGSLLATRLFLFIQLIIHFCQLKRKLAESIKWTNKWKFLPKLNMNMNC